MFSRKSSIVSACVALGITASVLGIALLIVRSVWRAMSANPTVAVAAISAVATIVAATLVVMLGRYFERKKETEAHFRPDKIKMYDEFLLELFKTFHATGEEKENPELVEFLREWQRKLVLWGGSDVLRTYFKWMTRLKAGNPDAETIFLMDEFFRALRADVGHNSKGLSRGAFSHLILRDADYFLAEAAKNPAITLSELSRKEKELSSIHPNANRITPVS
jgi:hypothetical protein